MPYLAKYGVEFTLPPIPIPKKDDTDFAATGDWTPASGDVKVSKNAGNAANIAALPTAVGGTGSVLWKFVLSATEMQAKTITIQIVDAALENQAITVQTYGHANAQIVGDLDAVAETGDEMTLEDDAITAAKFDESSAWPLVAADSGATMLARTGADSDTLETLADFIAIAQDDLDVITGTDGTTLATLQGNYAPAKVGALMGLADGAITAAKIAAAAFIAAKFGADFLTAAKIADNAIGADQLAASAVQKIAITIIPKKNTAFTFDFPMVNDTTHNLQDGLSVSGVVIIDGASTVALDGSIAEVSDGIYRCSGSAVDMNGDDIAFLFTATGADPSPVFVFKTAA